MDWEYLDILRDVWASELASQWYVIGEHVNTTVMIDLQSAAMSLQLLQSWQPCYNHVIITVITAILQSLQPCSIAADAYCNMAAAEVCAQVHADMYMNNNNTNNHNDNNTKL